MKELYDKYERFLDFLEVLEEKIYRYEEELLKKEEEN